ncbi:MAG: transcriptional regulator [Gammaproteobacteria bacterium]|nr:MAG: transcriptional regulator [Gammaproteobacteria bacterium]
MIDLNTQQEAEVRLKKIEGQIRGISRMVQEEKYCIDIIHQVTAAEKALDKVAKIIMKRHIESCVQEAIRAGDPKQKVDELIQTVFKLSDRH